MEKQITVGFRMEPSTLTLRGPITCLHRQWSSSTRYSALTRTSERPAMNWQPRVILRLHRTCSGGKSREFISM